MSNQLSGFFFSANADRSANDYTVHVRPTDDGNWRLAPRYKNAEPNTSYEIELDTQDMLALGRLLVAFAHVQIRNEALAAGGDKA